jgi:hypothetical protein
VLAWAGIVALLPDAQSVAVPTAKVLLDVLMLPLPPVDATGILKHGTTEVVLLPLCNDAS